MSRPAARRLEEDKIHPAHLQGIFRNHDLLNIILLKTTNFKGAFALLFILHFQDKPELLAAALIGALGTRAILHHLPRSNWAIMKALLQALHTKQQMKTAWHTHIHSLVKQLIQEDKDSVLIPLYNYGTALLLPFPTSDYLLKQICKFKAPLCLAHTIQHLPMQPVAWRNQYSQSLLHLLTNHIGGNAAATLRCINLLSRSFNISSLVPLEDEDGDTPILYLISELGEFSWGSLTLGSYHRDCRTQILTALLRICDYTYPINQPTRLQPNSLLHYVVQHGIHEALSALLQIEGCNPNILLSPTRPITPLRAAVQLMAAYQGQWNTPPGLCLCGEALAEDPEAELRVD